MTERWLVTGALGCIGSWVVRVLLDESADVTTFDLDSVGHRLDLVVGSERLQQVRRITGDIRDPAAVRAAIDECGATHIVHLAALQIPFCRADPSLGAQVNVVGTVNVFETALAAIGQVQGLVYASSAAAYDPLETSSAGDRGDLPGTASTLYGVYKRANEATAQVYWAEHRLPSIGLRPHTVYGPGRDQGVTSQPTQAMLAAARGESYHIEFGGRVAMQYAHDVASDFIAAARAVRSEARVVNVGGTVASVADVVAAIVAVAPGAEGRITFGDQPLSFPADLVVDTTVFEVARRVPLLEGVRASIERFREVARV